MVPELAPINSVQALDSIGGRSQCLDEKSIPVLIWPFSACCPGVLLSKCLGTTVEKQKLPLLCKSEMLVLVWRSKETRTGFLPI